MLAWSFDTILVFLGYAATVNPALRSPTLDPCFLPFGCILRRECHPALFTRNNELCLRGKGRYNSGDWRIDETAVTHDLCSESIGKPSNE
jgi:hypothetical protein